MIGNTCFALFAPYAVLVIGGYFFGRTGNMDEVKNNLAEYARRHRGFDKRLLHLRIKGFSRDEAFSLLSALEAGGRASYKTNLRWDLLFPILYVAALVFAFSHVTHCMGDYGSWLTWTLPIIAGLADWLENGMLLLQLLRFNPYDQQSLSEKMIPVAATATRIKLTLIVTALILLPLLALFCIADV